MIDLRTYITPTLNGGCVCCKGAKLLLLQHPPVEYNSPMDISKAAKTLGDLGRAVLLGKMTSQEKSEYFKGLQSKRKNKRGKNSK